MVKWPLEKRSDVSRVVLKVNSLSVQWWTSRTSSSLNALMVLPVRCGSGRGGRLQVEAGELVGRFLPALGVRQRLLVLDDEGPLLRQPPVEVEEHGVLLGQ